MFVLDDRGLVTPSSEGTLSPDGHRFAGLPNFRPPERPNLIEEPAPVAIRLTNTGLPINELKPRLPPTAEEEPVIISAAAVFARACVLMIWPHLRQSQRPLQAHRPAHAHHR